MTYTLAFSDDELKTLGARATRALFGMPRRVRDYHQRRDDCPRQCLEIHLLASQTLSGASPFEAVALEGDHYELMADWDVHARRYVKVYAWFPRVLAAPDVVDLSVVLQ